MRNRPWRCAPAHQSHHTMVRLTAALVSALCEGADPSTISTLIASKRDLHEVVGLDVCVKLTRLDLSDNSLSSIEGLALCTNLRWLSVSGNLLKSLKGVESAVQLTVLNASRNQLTSLAEVTGLTQLRALILNNNLITAIDRLDNLRNLNTLVLSNNPIRELGNFANMLSSLSKISMSHCRIQALGASLRRCAALREARFAHNNLSVLPKELERNGQLQILDLGNNELHSWADLQVLGTMSSLKSLNLKGNSLCSQAQYAPKVLQLIPTLKTLDGQPVKAHSIKRKSMIPAHLGESKGQPNESKWAESETYSKVKRRKKQQVFSDASVDITPEDEGKPFIDLITEPRRSGVSLSAEDADGNAAETSQAPKLEVSACDGGYIQVGLGSSKKITGALAGCEIGLGGSSTWDSHSSKLAASAHSDMKLGSQAGYSRWNLKSIK